jgi:hypothetical protein
MLITYPKLGKLVITLSILILIISPDILISKENKSRATKYYNDKNISMFVQRVSLKEVVKLISIKLKLYSNKNDLKCRLRLFGNEGGNTFPIFERDIIKPIEVKKDSIGVSDIIVRINEDIQISYGQYFICLDSISDGLNWVSNEKEFKPMCESESGAYYKQLLRMREGNWLNGKYSFIYKCEYDTLKLDKSSYFKRTEISDIIANDTLKNRTINVFDYNNDKQFDILVDNKLYKNIGGLSYQEIPSITNLFKTTQSTMVFDINNDGNNEIVFIGEKDTVNNILLNSIYRCKNNDFGYIENFEISNLEQVEDYIVEDMNNDGYKDVILIQSDSSVEKYILLKNQNGKFEKDNNFTDRILKEHKDLKDIFINDYNNDGQKDILFSNNMEEPIIYINSGNFNFNQKRSYELSINVDGSKLENITEYPTSTIKNGQYVVVEDKMNSIYSEDLPEAAYILNTKIGKSLNLFDKNNSDNGINESKIYDINNDGINDIILLTNDQCHKSYLYIGESNNQYKYIGMKSGIYFNSFPQGALLADMNNDGQLDIVSYENGKVIIYKNTYETCETKNNYIKVKDNTNQLSDVTVKSKGLTYTYTQTLQRSKRMIYSGDIIVGTSNNNEIDTVQTEFNNGYTNQIVNPESKEIEINKIDKEQNIVRFDVELYPNPFKENVVATISMNFSEELTIKIMNITGEERYRTTINGKSGINEFKWDGRDKTNSSVESGMYMIEISSKNEKYVNKIIKID